MLDFLRLSYIWIWLSFKAMAILFLCVPEDMFIILFFGGVILRGSARCPPEPYSQSPPLHCWIGTSPWQSMKQQNGNVIFALLKDFRRKCVFNVWNCIEVRTMSLYRAAWLDVLSCMSQKPPRRPLSETARCEWFHIPALMGTLEDKKMIKNMWLYII